MNAANNSTNTANNAENIPKLRHGVWWRSSKLGDLDYVMEHGRGDIHGYNKKELRKNLSDAMRKDLCKTVLAPNGEIVGLMGVVKMHEGVGHLWSVMTPKIATYAKSATRIFKKVLKYIINIHSLHRIQCEVLAKERSWIRWLQIFGFEIEGVMEKYTTDKQNVIRMAYIDG